MPIPVQCPDCSARLNAPDAAGKKVKCPKCGAPVAVAAPAPAADFEVVDEPDEVDPPAEPAKKPNKKVAQAEVEEDEEDRPRVKKRRKDDDEDEDDKPRKKRGKAEPKSKKPLIFALVGVGLLVLVGGIGAAVYFATRSKGPDVAKGGGDGKPGTGGPAPVAELKMLPPRVAFKADFTAKDPADLTPRLLHITTGQDVVASTTGFEPQTQVWAAAGEPKKRWERKGRAEWLSMNGTSAGVDTFSSFGVFDVVSGEAAGASIPWTNARSVQTATERFDWGEAAAGMMPDRFRIRRYEVLPGKNQLGTIDVGDDGLIAAPAAVKQGTELVFGRPRKNKVEVFDFAKKIVVREFALSDPRELNTAVWKNGYPFWRAFFVSSDGKWITVKRTYSGKEPDPIEVFDATGTRVATIPSESVNEVIRAFVPVRDLYAVAVTSAVKGTNYRPGDIIVFDINKNAFVAGLRWGESLVISGIAVSPNGKSLAAAADGGRIAVWDLTQLP